MPSAVNVIDMGDQEWCYALFLHYRIDPPELTTPCDGYNAKFSIYHALDFKKGGLITNCRNKLRDGVAELAGKLVAPLNVRDDPFMHPGRAVREVKAHTAGSPHNNSLVTTKKS